MIGNEAIISAFFLWIQGYGSRTIQKDRVALSTQFFYLLPRQCNGGTFSADQSGKQNLVFSYAPNPLSTGSMVSDGNKGLVYTASFG